MQNKQAYFTDLIVRLHLYKADAVKLDCRGQFQQVLAVIIRKLIDLFKPDANPSRKVKSKKKAKKITSGREYCSLEWALAAQQNLIDSIEYKLKVLPQRIEDQFTAIRR